MSGLNICLYLGATVVGLYLVTKLSDALFLEYLKSSRINEPLDYKKDIFQNSMPAYWKDKNGNWRCTAGGYNQK